MKRIAICCSVSVLLVLCACGKAKIVIPEKATAPEVTMPEITAPEVTAPEATSAASELVTGLRDEADSPAQTTERKTDAAPAGNPASTSAVRRVLYGKDTGTDRTYTGLEPLPKAALDYSAMKTGLSKETIDHSFGVAKDGKPHSISVEAQKRFDENGLEALVYDNRATEKTLYLTFDCGYDNGQTEKILDTLKEKGVKAAFFCTRPEMESVPELTARMIKEGHIVGNHSVTHPDFSAIPHEQMLEEVQGFDDWLRENCGYSTQFFRFPMGKYSLDAVAALNAMGYRCVFWSLAYYDWDLQKQPTKEEAIETVVSRLHPGAVILLHAVSPANAAALPEIIDTAREMGYAFKGLDDG